MDTSRIHSLARHLRATLLTDRRVSVHLRHFSSRSLKLGDTDCTAKRFTIRINRDLALETAVGVLIHEWAHILAWEMDGPDSQDVHGEMFKLAEPFVFSSYMEWRTDGSSR